MKFFSLLITLAFVSAPAAAQDFLSKDGPLAGVKREIGIDQKLDGQVPLDLPFVDESGKNVLLGDYFGERPVILVPVYYRCPMLCNMVLEGVTESVANIRFDAGKEYEIVAFSFDPKDTPEGAAEKKAIYTKRYGRPGSAAGWHFLTGSEESIAALTEAIGFRYRYDPSIDQFAHGAGVMVVTPKGKLARYFYGIEYHARDLRLGLVEAAEEKIGSAVDQLLLMCYDYDPATGKYSAIAMNSVRIGGVITLLGLGGFIAIMIGRERKKAKQTRDGKYEQ